MRSTFICLYLVLQLHAGSVFAQSGTAQQLRAAMARAMEVPGYEQDTAYLNIINRLAYFYGDNYPDSALLLLEQHFPYFKAAGYERGLTSAYINYGIAWYTKGNYKKANEQYDLALSLAEKNNNEDLQAKILNNLGLTAMDVGNYSQALRYYYQSLELAEKLKDSMHIGRTYNNIAIVHFYQGKMDEAERSYRKLLDVARSAQDIDGIILANNNIGEVYLQRKQLTEARNYFATALETATAHDKWRYMVSAYKNMGLVYLQLDSAAVAASYFEKAYAKAIQASNQPSAATALTGLAKAQLQQQQIAAALQTATSAAALATQLGNTQLLRDAHEILSNVYEAKNDGRQALVHYKLFKQYADSLQNAEAERTSERLKASFDFSKKELEFERTSLQQRWLIFSAFAALITALLVILLVYRSRQKEKKANWLLQQKNTAIVQQKSIAEEALEQLKATQKQLIQSEKMASLGEMTAGIAHEIQNPLNFVTNFSDVSIELLQELLEEMNKGNRQEVSAITNDLLGNLDKIKHHGERASSIVKGMLQHSRSNSGQKEPTDINALCDEYLRLAYHGLRAKDKSFNASFDTQFDASIGTVNIVPQDLGRVLLNLTNNAFYAVTEKQKTQTAGYQPTVTIRTKKEQNKVIITVSDNGTGIPQQLIDKIFQPFFTTKPTGLGTGLGLSLSYDIIKAQGGTLEVDTREGEGTTFIIQLPA